MIGTTTERVVNAPYAMEANKSDFRNPALFLFTLIFFPPYCVPLVCPVLSPRISLQYHTNQSHLSSIEEVHPSLGKARYFVTMGQQERPTLYMKNSVALKACIRIYKSLLRPTKRSTYAFAY
jgi:hypothetical protein